MKQQQKQKTILFIHGIMVGGWCWDKYKSFFEARGYRCVAPNLPYHGKGWSVKPDKRLGSQSLSDYIDYLKREIDRLDLAGGEKPIVISHSMGGLLAQKIAEQGLVDMLVAITPAPPKGIFALSRYSLKSVLGMKIPLAFWKSPIGVTLKGMEYMALHLTPPDERIDVFEKTGYESGRVMLELSFSFLDPYNCARVDEKKIGCPMLVVSAGKDRLLPPKVVKKIAKKYSADYKNFEEHAHWIIAEPGWKEPAEYILNWIKQQSSQ